MKKKLIISIIVLLQLLISSYAYSLKQPKSNAEILQETISALDITKNKSLGKLTTLNKIQDKTLYHEYTVFVEYLSFQISEYCEQLVENYGKEAIRNLPCYSSTNASAYKIETPDKKEYATAEEQIDSLDNELMAALGNFDEMLLDEEEMIAQNSRKNNQNGGGKNSASRAGSGTVEGVRKRSEKQQQSGDVDKENSQAAKGNNKQPSGTGRENRPGTARGKGKESQKQKQNRRRLDQIDDDIVARQLKEAAEQETDPELKEKLWNEYYKYKHNTVK